MLLAGMQHAVAKAITVIRDLDGPAPDSVESLENRIEKLQRQVEELTRQNDRLRERLGDIR